MFYSSGFQPGPLVKDSEDCNGGMWSVRYLLYFSGIHSFDSVMLHELSRGEIMSCLSLCALHLA